jgi:KTSC domain
MQRSPIASSAVISAAYDAVSSTLELEFSSGRVYQYEAVPASAYQWLLRTRSKGTYVSRMINGQYSYRDVTPFLDDVLDLETTLRRSLSDLHVRNDHDSQHDPRDPD